jgi:hypothetical protein
MTNKDDEAKQKGMIEAYNAAIAAGEPLVDWAMHEILKIRTFPTGEVLIDFVFAKSPDSLAMVARLAVSSEAARILKATLAKNENIPDTLPLKRDPQSRN